MKEVIGHWCREWVSVTRDRIFSVHWVRRTSNNPSRIKLWFSLKHANCNVIFSTRVWCADSREKLMKIYPESVNQRFLVCEHWIFQEIKALSGVWAFNFPGVETLLFKKKKTPQCVNIEFSWCGKHWFFWKKLVCEHWFCQEMKFSSVWTLNFPSVENIDFSRNETLRCVKIEILINKTRSWEH